MKTDNLTTGLEPNELPDVYSTLQRHYGPSAWWPAKTSYEVMVGAILTQNTAWSNVEKALRNFGDKLDPVIVSQMSLAELEAIIRPAGFFRQKALYLKALGDWWSSYDYDIESLRDRPLPELRAEILRVRGVGRETADSILLYAFGLRSFVIDAYTVRLCTRLPLNADLRYESLKRTFEDHLPHSVDIYNNFHALIVIHGKAHCRKKPLCEACPLADVCQRRGVESAGKDAKGELSVRF